MLFTIPCGQRSCFTFLPPSLHPLSAQQATATHFSWQLTLLLLKVQKCGLFLKADLKVSPCDQAATSLGGHCSPEGSASPNPTSHLISSPRSQQVQVTQLFLHAREMNRINTEQIKWWLQEGNMRAHRSNQHFSVLILWPLKRTECETRER